jgi:Na+/H+-dicarboxylate symporter
MSFTKKILVGLASGLFLGLFFGERVAFLHLAAEGFVQLLQMTVLPYVMVSLILGLGSLDYQEAWTLFKKLSALLLLLWAIAIGMVFAIPLAFPDWESASFFSTALLEEPEPFDFLGLYVPANPFHSLANNIVPAVVLFSVIFGVALIGVEKKHRLLEVMCVMSGALTRATHFVVSLTPYGVFAIAAHTAGTMTLEELARIQVYLVTYMAVALLATFWLLPALISTLTPIKYGEVIGAT